MFGDAEVSTTFAAENTGVAQLVEHRSPKPGVDVYKRQMFMNCLRDRICQYRLFGCFMSF